MNLISTVRKFPVGYEWTTSEVVVTIFKTKPNARIEWNNCTITLQVF